MTPSNSLQMPLASAIVAAPDADDELTRERNDEHAVYARGECTDTRWFVRVVLAAGSDGNVQSVRAIVDDRDEAHYAVRLPAQPTGNRGFEARLRRQESVVAIVEQPFHGTVSGRGEVVQPLQGIACARAGAPH